MLDHLKALLAVAGGVGVGAVTLTLQQPSQYEISTGGGNTFLANVDSGNSVTQETVFLNTTEGATDSHSGPEQTDKISEPAQSTWAEDRAELLTPALPAKEENQENCSIVDSQNLNDVFYNLIDNKSYFLVSCSWTNKVSDNEWSNEWAGLFPSHLFSNRDTVKKFKMTTETTDSSDNGTVTFSSEVFSSKEITGKKDVILQATLSNKQNFLIQKINLEIPSAENIFLTFNEDIGFLRQSS